jgi:hypothetical protein
MRVGEIIPETTNAGANHTPPPTAISHQSGNRPVTDESRLVTALILLVNARVRKHRIPVSGLTRRTFRRVATSFRDDRLRGHKRAISRGETKPHRTKMKSAKRHGFGPTLRLFSRIPYNYREGQTVAGCWLLIARAGCSCQHAAPSTGQRPDRIRPTDRLRRLARLRP